MAIRNLNINEEKYREAINELERLEYQHKNHYKVVRKSRIGVAIGLTIALTATIMIVDYGRRHPNWPAKSETVQTMVEDQPIKLHRYYKVKFGDSLAGISEKTGVPISTIRHYNDMSPKDSLIYPNQGLDLVYEVKEKNLEYYTERYKPNGKSLESVAADYNTDVETIISLNPGQIIKNPNDGSYTLLTDSILIPHFITPSQLREAKQNNNQK